MARVQLALNVSDLDAAVAFYSALFAADPAKRRPGYANFALDDPPLKLVLIEAPEDRGGGVTGALNHLGVEVDSSWEVDRNHARLTAGGLGPRARHETTCCYALQDKAWVSDPDGVPWEIYTVLADAPPAADLAGDGQCCEAPAPVSPPPGRPAAAAERP